MSCIENDRLYENTCEAFFEAMDNDPDFHHFIYENFLSYQAQWIEAKMTCEIDTDIYGQIFEDLWKWDTEGMCENFKQAAKSYKERMEMEYLLRSDDDEASNCGRDF